MGPEIVNRNKDSIFHGDFVGRDQNVTNIILFQDNEREFVVTHNANIKPVSYFTGRETELRELRQRIEDGRKSVLVSGMGGIGKTHICRKLFEEYVDKHENGSFQHIGYIEYDGEIDSSLQRCLKFKKQSDPEKNKEAVWQELEYLASSGKLLLFVDNVNVSIGEDPNLKRLMSIPGAIILSSRRRVFSKEFEPYRIGFLSIEQCKEIYEKIRYENSDTRITEEEEPDLEYIIETLVARHTITIEFLANLAWTNNWTVKRLRNELERNGFRLEYMDEEDKLVNIQKSYEILYDMSMLTEAEQNILEAFSVFPYNPLKAEMCNQWLLEDAGVSEEDNILSMLYRKGWMQYDMEQDSYAMHPVFAQFIYEKCRPKAEKHSKLIRSCEESLKIPESGSPLACQQYLPFAENIIRKTDLKKGEEHFKFVCTLAYLNQQIGEYEKSIKWYEEELCICENIWNKNNLNVAIIYNNLAGVFDCQGDYENAQRLYEKSLCIYERVLGKNHLDAAPVYNNLAGVYDRQGKYEDAQRLYEKCLFIYKSVLGEQSQYIASIYNNLAGVFDSRGEYAKAEELYKKSLEMNKRILGEEHPDIARNYNNLAAIYNSQGEYVKAQELYEKSLQINKRMLGENHPDTASSYSNLAVVYNRQGKYVKAKILYEKSLYIREKILGENHPDTATSYNNLAVMYYSQGNYQDAKKLYEKSLYIREKVLGENHPDTATSYNNLAVIYYIQDKYEEAKELYEKSLRIRENKIGTHPDTATTYHNLGCVYEKQGKYTKAQELLEKALYMRKKIFGENYNDTGTSYYYLGGVYAEQGEYEKALDCLQKAYKIMLSLRRTAAQITYDNLEIVFSKWNPEGNFEEWLVEQMKG